MYIQLRITVDPSGNRNKQAVWEMLRQFQKRWINAQCGDAYESSCGYEVLNKYGEPCAPHYHLNICLDTGLQNALRSAREWFKRYAQNHDFILKGNKVWSCTAVEEPSDYDRWLRYPLKEKEVVEFCKYDSPEWALLQQVHAVEERKRSIELNIIKREKLADKVTFKDKLFVYLEEKDPKSHQDIWISILNYYKEGGKAVCFKTVNGYTILYQLCKGYITPVQAYQMRS